MTECTRSGNRIHAQQPVSRKFPQCCFTFGEGEGGGEGASGLTSRATAHDLRCVGEIECFSSYPWTHKLLICRRVCSREETRVRDWWRHRAGVVSRSFQVQISGRVCSYIPSAHPHPSPHTHTHTYTHTFQCPHLSMRRKHKSCVLQACTC